MLASEKKEISILLERVSSNLKLYYPGIDSGELLSVEGPRQFEYSTVYLIRFRGAPRKVLIKVFRGEVEMALLQYGTLKVLWPLFSDKCRGLTVPRPLDLFADLNAIVMEEIPGRNLKELIHRSRWYLGSHTLEAFKKSGMWLRQFHYFGNNGNKDKDVLKFEEVLEEIQEQLKRCVEHDLDQRLAADISNFLASEVHGIAQHEEPVSYLHGDFKIDNVVVSDQDVGAVDFSIRRRNLIHYDLASFCNSIDLIRMDPQHLWISNGFLGRAKEIFLLGYFGGEAYSMRKIEVFQVIGLVAKCLYLSLHHAHHFFRRRFVLLFLNKQFHTLMGKSMEESIRKEEDERNGL